MEHFVKSCRVCQLRKSPNPTTTAPVGEIKSFYPFEWLSWDITGPLPVTDKGNRYILVVTDLFTKWMEAFPLQAVDSVTLATVLVDEIVDMVFLDIYTVTKGLIYAVKLLINCVSYSVSAEHGLQLIILKEMDKWKGSTVL